MYRDVLRFISRLKWELNWVREKAKGIPYWLYVIAVIAIFILLFKRFVLHQTDWASWTGFGSYVDFNGAFHQGKKLWDWLDLLIIPVVLAFAAIWFNNREREYERDIAENKNQEMVLQNYLDKMHELILKENLKQRRESFDDLNDDNSPNKANNEKHDVVINIARTRTVTVLRQLNQDRKNVIFQFLRDTDLSDFILISAPLEDVDLGVTKMHNLNMHGAKLSWACLYNADLCDTDLSDANLSGADMSMAELTRTNFSDAFMPGADLTEACLNGANLVNTILSESDLSRANFGSANLQHAFLSRSILVDTILWKANLNEARLGFTRCIGADLTDSTLCLADLNDADLTGACLMGANLYRADLSGANLYDADLTDSNLRQAVVTIEQLSRTKSLSGAIMPDGSKHEKL